MFSQSIRNGCPAGDCHLGKVTVTFPREGKVDVTGFPLILGCRSSDHSSLTAGHVFPRYPVRGFLDGSPVFIDVTGIPIAAHHVMQYRKQQCVLVDQGTLVFHKCANPGYC